MSADNDWDGKFIHFGFAPGQSAQEADVACGIVLSTWNGPNAQLDKDDWNYHVGYTFEPEKVDCKTCIDWMEQNFNKCKCGKIAEHRLCTACAEEHSKGKFCLTCRRLNNYCQCKDNK